jgi:NADH dehydrogenase FAD-containing subunit
VTIVSDQENVLPTDCEAVRNEVLRKFKEKNIKVERNGKVAKITETHVHLIDDR